MEYVIKSFNELSVSELYEVLRLRFNVFVIEQECIYEELDNKDQASLHFLGYEEGKLVAYLRILPCGISFTEASIGRFVVDPAYRKNGYGRILFEGAIEYITQVWNEKKIKIEAQTYMSKFYESTGFKVTSEPFLDAGIEHVEMLFELE